MNAERNAFDLDASWARRAKGDMRAFAEALAARLEAALPDAVQVDRRRDGLFSSTAHVTRITVRVEGGLLTLDIDRGRLRALRAKVVRGVTIGTSEVTVPVWLQEVLRYAHTTGEEVGAAHDALHDFLMS